jgi:hypothetical protein
VLRFGSHFIAEGYNYEKYIQQYSDFFDVVMVDEKSLETLWQKQKRTPG